MWYLQCPFSVSCKLRCSVEILISGPAYPVPTPTPPHFFILLSQKWQGSPIHSPGLLSIFYGIKNKMIKQMIQLTKNIVGFAILALNLFLVCWCAVQQFFLWNQSNIRSCAQINLQSKTDEICDTARQRGTHRDQWRQKTVRRPYRRPVCSAVR